MYMYMYIYIYIYTWMYVYTYIYMCVCVCVCVWLGGEEGGEREGQECVVWAWVVCVGGGRRKEGGRERRQLTA